jgi:hypothetical protein
MRKDRWRMCGVQHVEPVRNPSQTLHLVTPFRLHESTMTLPQAACQSALYYNVGPPA